MTEVFERLTTSETFADAPNDCDASRVGALPDEALIDASATLLKGLADATRLKILCLLREGEVCVHTIVEALDISQSGISHQLRLLRNLRLVTSRKEGRHVFYRLADDHVVTMLENALSHGEEGRVASG